MNLPAGKKRNDSIRRDEADGEERGFRDSGGAETGPAEDLEFEECFDSWEMELQDERARFDAF